MVMLQLKGFILKFLPVDALPAAAPQPYLISTVLCILVRCLAGGCRIGCCMQPLCCHTAMLGREWSPCRSK